MLSAPPVRDLAASPEAPVPAGTFGGDRRPSARVATVVEALGAFDQAIVVVRGQSFSANLLGRVVFGTDGADHHAVRLTGCECHVHVDWSRAVDVSWGVEDVGYGAEPVVRLLDDRGHALVRLFYPPESRDALGPHLDRAVAALDGNRNATNATAVDSTTGRGRDVGVPVAIVHPAGSPALNATERDDRLALLRELGLAPTDDSHPGTRTTAASRAGALAGALSDPTCPIVWASGGGYGSTEVVPLLRDALPAAPPPTWFVGFSDVSCIGVRLGLQWPHVRYVHACNAYDPLLFSGRRDDTRTLFRVLAGDPPPPRTVPLAGAARAASRARDCAGPIVPLNLSVACALAVGDRVPLPPRSVLFLEDVNDDLHRLLRAVDVLAASSWLDPVAAVVVGELHGCTDADGGPLAPETLAGAVAERTAKPVACCAEFGHGLARLPLVMGAMARLAFSAGTLEIGFAP